jgi:hypothetical protein
LILRFDARTPALCLTALLLPLNAMAQAPAQAPVPQEQPPSQNTTQRPPQIPPSGKKPTVPDYPDPRTITVGIWGWAVIPGNGPDIIGGKQATGFETLDSLGKDHNTPGVDVSIPVTRTAELRFEGFLSKGDATQDAPAATTIFATAYAKGDFLNTQYQITAMKLSYDDLLYPFKFPVSRFRVKSLWEAQFLAAQGTIDAPFKANTTDSSGNLISNSASGTRTIILPTFGAAAEYALTPHILVRADASGFGLPHRAEIWDAEAYVSYRRNKLEFRGGYKILHFKSSPQIDEYMEGTVQGGFVGVRYHFQ